MTRARLAACLAIGLLAALDARAVSLNSEGRGQALIYPYYTARATTGGNPFNTYITVANHDTRPKAIRVRFREGRMGREVANFNLFLSGGDMWAAAVVPTLFGAKLITQDRSCTSPALFPVDVNPTASQVGELEFSQAAYSGSNIDGLGEGPDREREGYVEMIEMATLTGDSARAPRRSRPRWDRRPAISPEPARSSTSRADWTSPSTPRRSMASRPTRSTARRAIPTPISTRPKSRP
jgi:hypothetical protein